MFEAIILGMAKSLASYLFGGYLKAHYGSVEIDNAPSWYGKEPREAVCVSDYSPYGGIQKIEIVKNRTKIGLKNRIDKIISVVIYQNFKNLTPDEDNFLNRVKKDTKLPLFIEANMRFQNIKVDKKGRVFVRSCIDKNNLINYEKRRLKKLSKELSYYKSDKAFEEMEKGF
jgi:hypothetical protein